VGLGSGSGRLWLIGGTSDSAAAARELAQRGVPTVVSVTTAAAVGLYPEGPGVQVAVGPLTAEALPAFRRRHRVFGILDASHPFATDISALAVAAAEDWGLPYLRLERPPLPPVPWVQSFADVETLLASNLLLGQRVLLTVGYRWLAQFAPWQERCCLFARLLPSTVALAAAAAAGFSADRLIALRPPISPELERALWQQWAISVVVAKASGQAGGESTKAQVAQDMGVTLALIQRPRLAYPACTACATEASQICQAWWQQDVIRLGSYSLE